MQGVQGCRCRGTFQTNYIQYERIKNRDFFIRRIRVYMIHSKNSTPINGGDGKRRATQEMRTLSNLSFCASYGVMASFVERGKRVAAKETKRDLHGSGHACLQVKGEPPSQRMKGDIRREDRDRGGGQREAKKTQTKQSKTEKEKETEA